MKPKYDGRVLNMNIVIDTIMKRRSIRAFQSRQIDDSALETMLECALHAPSACNTQPWHFTVIQNAQLIKYLNDTASAQLRADKNGYFKSFVENCSDLLYGAPTLIIVSGNKNGVDPQTDCAAAVQNMTICAQSLGLGTLWNGLINHAFKINEARVKARIPEGYDTYYGLAVGYAQESFVPRSKEIIRDGVIDYIK